MIRVMLADDQILVRQGINSLLSLTDHIKVITNAANGEEVLELLNRGEKPDVILMDIRMPKMDGVSTLEAMAGLPDMPPVLMLTTFDDHQTVIRALKNGAKGYLLKDVSLDVLVDAIERLAAGGNLIQPSLSHTLLTQLQAGKQDTELSQDAEPLSDKETEVLRLVAAGLSNQEIAEVTFKSLGTVKNQMSSILSKLNVPDRTRAVLKALEQGWI